jgi:hypothetical protein
MRKGIGEIRMLAALRHCTLSLSLVLLAACGAETTVGDEKAAANPGGARWVNQRLEIDVPVRVVTFGLPPATVAGLQQQLTPKVIDQRALDYGQALPLDQEPHESDQITPDGIRYLPNPVLPRAMFSVAAAGEALEKRLREQLALAEVAPGRYDANRIEDWLAAALAPDPSAPTLVLLHLAALGVGDHDWRISTPRGPLDRTRVFGEREPLIVLDASATADPNGPRPAMSPDDVAPLVPFVTGAVEWRLLQGPIYPVATAACHAVTVVIAADTTSLSATTGLLPMALERLDAQYAEDSLRILTGGEPVFVDFKILHQPLDDPALAALSRGGGNGAHLELMRFYFSENWQQYHIPHEGCEAYLSVLFDGDLGHAPNPLWDGIATYDDDPGRRLSLSWLADIENLVYSPESPLCMAPSCVPGGPGSDQIWKYIINHETGHLFGQRHPHDIDRPDALYIDRTYSSVHSDMSYLMTMRLPGFGAIDQNNWQRNRAGFALLEADRAGRVGSPGWHAAMAAARRLDWRGAWEALQR